jgi:hypothetical protein
MKIIYAYYQQEESLFLQDLPSVGDWEDIMDDLHKREHNILLFQYIFRDRTTWEIVHHLRGFANMATSDETKLRDMHLGDVPTVCTACGNLDPRIWGTNNYLTYVVDVQHASSECSACMVIIRGFSAIVKPLEGIAQLTLSVRKEASLRVRCRWKTYASWDSRYLEFYVQQGM